MIAIDENFRISETGGTGNATIFVNATTENPFSTASTQIEVSSSVGNIKRYVTLNKKAAHGYMYTPVEWISNEDINTRIWIDLGYTWTNTTKAEIKMMIPTGNTANGTEIFGEWFDWHYASKHYEPVDDTNDLRLFFDGSKCYWDTPGNNRQQLYYSKGTAYVWEIGNQYLKNITSGTQQTGTTIDFGTRTSTVGLFGAPASDGYTHKARFYYIKIYEGDTLVRDIIPVLDKDNIPCFFDKVTFQFYYYKVNGEPSTGLTAGNIAYYTSDYLQGDGSDYIDIGYVPNASTSIEIDFEGDSGDLFGATDRGAGNGMFGYFQNNSWNWRYANKYGDFPKSTFSGRTLYKMTPSGDYVNNVQRSSWSGSWSNTSASFYIFGIHRESTGLSGAVFNGKIYGVKIFEGDTLVREYIPYKSYGNVGLYEKINDIFYPSQKNTITQNGNVQPVVEKVVYSESDITISNDTPSTAINTTFNLNASTTPTGATLTYSSSDTSIATVDSNGVITAVAEGTATITITAQAFQDNINHIYYNATSKTVSVECEEVYGYSYTPVEYVSNEGLLQKHWVDLDYVWKDNSKLEMGYIMLYTNSYESWQVFGEDNQFDANGNIINDNDDIRLFLYNYKAYWDVTNGRVEKSLANAYNNYQMLRFGNNYIEDIREKSTTTDSTYSISRTKTVGLFGSPKYANAANDRIKIYYVKIWEGDTLVRDIIPVLDSNNIPCFFDKVNARFHYYEVNGVPSTGLTAGGAIAEYSYIDNGGVTSYVNCYIPINYVWKTNSRAVMSLKVQSAQSGHLFSDEDNSNRLRLFPTYYGQFQMDYRGTTITASNRNWNDVQNIEIGNYYIKDTDTGTDIATGATKTDNQSSYCFLFGYTDKIQYYSVKIYEGDTLVCDLVPAMANNGYKGFWDKKRCQFFFDRGNNNDRLYVGTKIQDIVVTQIYSKDDVVISNNTPSGALSIGDIFSLGASTTPTGATLSYSSSDTSIATVDSNGVVTAVGKGTTTITITASDVIDNVNNVYYKGTSKAVSIECAYPTQQIIITKDTPSKAVGIEETFDLNVSTTPIGATVTYSSSDTSVATVSNQGVITGVATGTTTITIVAEGFDDDVNHITYTSTSATVSVTVADGVVETYDFMNGDGNDYIITDYAPNRNSVIEVKYENQDGFGDLIGFENRSTGERFRFEDNGHRIIVYGNNSSVDTDSIGGVIKKNGENVEFNGSKIGSTSYTSNTDNLPLYIFATNFMNRQSNTYQGRIFYVKVWENNTLVHEWVGATKGNKVGVYDTVTSVFTASQENDLTVGNEVLPENSKYFLIKSTSSQQGIPPYVSFFKKGSPSGSLYYRKLNDTAWTEVTGNTSIDLAGETGYVELKGSIHNDEDDQWQIGGANIEPQGYLAAIARNEEITSSNNSIAGTYAKFYNLFGGNYHMTNIKNIIFPTDTSPACYEGMFKNCSQITTAPVLPATRLSSECYKEMFKNCYYLRTIPSAMLPATTLAQDCYYGMFEGCYSITTGPNLPALSTIQGCYYAMFKDCEHLEKLRVSFRNTPRSHINNWLKNIKSTGTLYAPSNATYSASDLQLPSNWTLSKTSPVYFDASNPRNANIQTITDDRLSGVTTNTPQIKRVYLVVANDAFNLAPTDYYSVKVDNGTVTVYDSYDNTIVNGVREFKIGPINYDINLKGTYRLDIDSLFFFKPTNFYIELFENSDSEPSEF